MPILPRIPKQIDQVEQPTHFIPVSPAATTEIPEPSDYSEDDETDNELSSGSLSPSLSGQKTPTTQEQYDGLIFDFEKEADTRTPSPLPAQKAVSALTLALAAQAGGTRNKPKNMDKF
jgi:hypothetical protein